MNFPAKVLPTHHRRAFCAMPLIVAVHPRLTLNYGAVAIRPETEENITCVRKYIAIRLRYTIADTRVNLKFATKAVCHCAREVMIFGEMATPLFFIRLFQEYPGRTDSYCKGNFRMIDGNDCKETVK